MFIVVYEVYFCLGICIIDPSSFHFLARIHSKGEDIVLCLYCEQKSGSVWEGGWWDAMSYSEKGGLDPSCILFCPWEACCLCWNFSKWKLNEYVISCRSFCQLLLLPSLCCATCKNLAARCGHLKYEGVWRPQTSGLRHHVGSLLCLYLDYPEDGGSRLLQNASSIAIYMASNPRRVESSPALLWASQISCGFLYLIGWLWGAIWCKPAET